MLIRDILLRYRQDREPEVLNPKALANACTVLNRYFAHYTPLDLFDDKIVRGFAEARLKGTLRVQRGKVGVSTVRRELGVLQSALYHVRRVRAYTGDAPSLWKPKSAPPRRAWLQRTEAAAMLQDIASRARRWPHRVSYKRSTIFMLISLFTGARESAVRGLTWDRVYLTNNGLSNGYIDFRDPTVPISKKRRAVVPISDELLPYLLKFKEEATTEYVCIDTGCVRDILRGAARRVGVKDFHTHILRKSFATWAAQDSVDIAMIAEALGDTVESTMASYAVFHPDYMSKLTKRTTLGGSLLGEA